MIDIEFVFLAYYSWLRGRKIIVRYDGILFGNGMSINLINQVMNYVPVEKQYLLKIDSFIEYWIEGKLSERENRQLYRAFYGNSRDKWKYYDLMKLSLAAYYEKYDSNIEYTMGRLLFADEKEEKIKECIQIFPALYNIWHIILKQYFEYLKLGSEIKNFYESVNNIISNPNNIWTTNFDLFAETIHAKHIHGRFVEEMKDYSDVVYKFTNKGKNYYYKYIWGHNGVGKWNLINELRKYHDYNNYFDFDFFFCNDVKLDRLLVYGMGFKTSGFIEDMKVAMPRYNKPAFGAVVDEHILLRIGGMQNLGIINHLDITYYDESEKAYLEDVLHETQVKKYNLVPSSSFDFSISRL